MLRLPQLGQDLRLAFLGERGQRRGSLQSLRTAEVVRVTTEAPADLFDDTSKELCLTRLVLPHVTELMINVDSLGSSSGRRARLNRITSLHVHAVPERPKTRRLAPTLTREKSTDGP